MGVSLKPSSFTKGGLVDDVDVTITGAQFVMWSYERADIPEVPALKLDLQTETGDVVDQYLSAGDAKYFVPSEDGSELVAVGSRTTLNDNSNMALFMRSLIEVGFDETRIEDDISVLCGVQVHVRRVEQPARAGIVQPVGEGQEARKRTVLTVTQIISCPWDEPEEKPAEKAAPAKAAPKKAKAKAKTAKAEPAEAPDGSDEVLTSIVQDILGNSDGQPIQKAELVQRVYQQAVARKLDRESQKTVTRRVYQDEFLVNGMAQGLWFIDGDTVSAS